MGGHVDGGDAGRGDAGRELGFGHGTIEKSAAHFGDGIFAHSSTELSISAANRSRHGGGPQGEGGAQGEGGEGDGGQGEAGGE